MTSHFIKPDTQSISQLSSNIALAGRLR